MKKQITFEPGYDYICGVPARGKNAPKKGDYGRHGMTIRFVLIGEKGAVHFLFYTDWLPRVKDEIGMWKPTFYSPYPDPMFPMAVDIGYHSHTPRYEGQTKRDSCPYLNGKPCYSDGSSTAADDYLAIFINEGEKALWKAMKKYYQELFETK